MDYEIICSTKNLSREEWLSMRKLGIGGSDVSIIAGCNPYRSVFELWHEKRGEMSSIDKTSGEAAYWGNVLENVVRKEFTNRTGKAVRRKNAILRNKEHQFMIADLDGVVSEFDGTYSIFEAKTAIEFKNNDWKNGEIPRNYQLQVQHYMAVTGFRKTYIAVLVGGNKFYWYEVYRDEQLIKILISMEAHFWNCVRTGEEPDVDASEATAVYLGERYKNTKAGSVIKLDDKMLPVINDYKMINEEIAVLQKRKKLLGNQLRAALADNEIGTLGEHTVKWKPMIQKGVDTDKLEKEFKEAYDACEKKTGYRRLSVA